ncbi:SDR family NAD(P)-dependent oxidoreductase [Sandaracinobacteroides saxicola]|uniref:SDR family NAD(P)-dependent oxidoreductase n=1 Tax=Sandaracinobacteroides saxicola TaxID=2759707 RepID=A0A7G5IDT1_9SPHN|nr:SDR family NAD(P)-dependent oxidoreductase [Sandaracinobacteroides saxicola]QMW21523.1 SDR family NAD(P)-dependent oxidoreductase [Sandaracinobacteroides saxicola]
MSFENKVVWITGASSGIGRGMAEAFQAAGAWVIASGRNQAALSEVVGSGGNRTRALPFEATDIEALPGLVERVIADAGRIDMLVNNAGISQRDLAVDTELHVYRTIMEVDFFAPVALTKAVLPHMLARGEGHVAAVASVAGKVGSPQRTGYSAAKHAVMGFYDALRTEVEHQGVRVSTIVPGFVRTEIGARALRGDGQVKGAGDDDVDAGITPAEAAAIILPALAAGQREIPVGAANGMEMALLDLKRQDPERLFDMMGQFGAAVVQKFAEGRAR